jgi:putative transposase
MRALKGATAREANLLLGRTGTPFWQGETYDHWVRNQSEWERIAAYIENNPVKAGLVARVEDHRWSSAAEPRASAGISPGAAGTSARATSG